MPMDKKTLFASQDNSLSLSPRLFSSELVAYAFAMGNIGIGTIRDSCSGGHGNLYEPDWLVSHAVGCVIIVWARLSMWTSLPTASWPWLHCSKVSVCSES